MNFSSLTFRQQEIEIVIHMIIYVLILSTGQYHFTMYLGALSSLLVLVSQKDQKRTHGECIQHTKEPQV